MFVSQHFCCHLFTDSIGIVCRPAVPELSLSFIHLYEETVFIAVQRDVFLFASQSVVDWTHDGTVETDS